MSYQNNKKERLIIGHEYEIKIMNIINNYFKQIKFPAFCIQNTIKDKYAVDLKIVDSNNNIISYIECKHIHNIGNRLYIKKYNGEGTGPNLLYEYVENALKEDIDIAYAIYDEFRGYVYISTYNTGLKEMLEKSKKQAGDKFGNVYFKEDDFSLKLSIKKYS